MPAASSAKASVSRAASTSLRPLRDAPLQVLVGEPKLLLGALALEQVLARLVLAAARPQGGGRGAGQRLGIDRPLQQDDVAEAVQQLGGPLGAGGRPGASRAR